MKQYLEGNAEARRLMDLRESQSGPSLKVNACREGPRRTSESEPGLSLEAARWLVEVQKGDVARSEQLIAMNVDVPNTLSIVGFGDGPWQRTIRLPTEELAASCGSWFVDRLIRMAISFALMFRFNVSRLFQRPSWRKTRPIARKPSTRPVGHSLSIALAKFD